MKLICSLFENDHKGLISKANLTLILKLQQLQITPKSAKKITTRMVNYETVFIDFQTNSKLTFKGSHDQSFVR